MKGTSLDEIRELGFVEHEAKTMQGKALNLKLRILCGQELVDARLTLYEYQESMAGLDREEGSQPSTAELNDADAKTAEVVAKLLVSLLVFDGEERPVIEDTRLIVALVGTAGLADLIRAVSRALGVVAPEEGEEPGKKPIEAVPT